MRHRKSGRKFDRPSAQRAALFRSLSISLIEHELIKTTVAKAKELRRVIEPLITLAKIDSLAHRRTVYNRLRSDKAVSKLFADLGPRFNKRPGGYVRVLKAGFRKDDAAPIAIIEFVDKAAAKPVEEEQTKKASKAAKAPKTEKKVAKAA